MRAFWGVLAICVFAGALAAATVALVQATGGLAALPWEMRMLAAAGLGAAVTVAAGKGIETYLKGVIDDKDNG